MSQAVYIHAGTGVGRKRRFLVLLQALVIRELKGRYRRSFLGPAWAFLQPLMYMVIFTILRGVLSIPSEGVPYVVFSFSAIVPWTFFTGTVGQSSSAIFSNVGIIKKMDVARELFPMVGLITAFADFLVSSLILVAMLVWFHVPVGWPLLWVPPLVVMTAALALGIGLGVSALGVYKRDIVFAWGFVMQLWMWGTPIMYPLGEVPAKWLALYKLNPMVGIIEGFRSVLIRNAHPDLQLLGVSALGVLLVWAVAWPLFRRMSQYFADVL